MKAEVKRQWIEALRGGDYKQASFALRKSVRDQMHHCCLGVLCDLHAKATGASWEGDKYFNGSSCLPDQVCQWAGLTLDVELAKSVPIPALRHPLSNRPKTLLGLNDCGSTFSEIADVIEEHL